jgi:hypothetical protein
MERNGEGVKKEKTARQEKRDGNAVVDIAWQESKQ